MNSALSKAVQIAAEDAVEPLTQPTMLVAIQPSTGEILAVAANEAASCRYMKMITLPKLRETLRTMSPQVKVPEAIAERARVPIERMVAIN